MSGPVFMEKLSAEFIGTLKGMCAEIVTLSLKKAPEESARIHADLKAVGADLLVVAAYGLILPQAVLDCAKGIGRNGDIRAINIHGSLLPRWRARCARHRVRRCGKRRRAHEDGAGP